MNRLILTCLSLLITCLVYGQQFAPIGAVWHFDQTNVHPPYYHDLWEFSVQKDTVIRGDTCHKVRAFYRRLNLTSGDTIKRVELYYLRSDSGKVDLYTQDMDSFMPYLNFNLGKGDTLTTVCDDHQILPFSVRIDSISHTVINGHTLKVQHISRVGFTNFCYLGDRIIERIGPLSYFFGFNGIADPGKGGPLRCYEDPSFGLYRHNPNVDCDFITSVNQTHRSQTKLFPNPCAHSFSVQSSVAYERVKIFNYLGKKVHEQAFANAIDVSHVLPGYYYVELSAASTQIVGKLLISR